MQFVAQWLEVQVIPISISIGYQCSTKVRYHVIVTVCMLHSKPEPSQVFAMLAIFAKCITLIHSFIK